MARVTLYLVRHAESAANPDRIHQHRDTPLHERAGAQIAALEQRLRRFDIHTLVASPFARTVATAEGVATGLGLPVRLLDDLREIRRPREMQGKATTDPDVLAIQAELARHFEEGSWRYSDEETFEELKTRGLSVLQQILDLNSPSVLAVSHAAIIRVIVACALFGTRLTPHDYMGFWHTVMDNVSVTELVHDPAAADMSPWGNPWKLLTFNSRTIDGEGRS